MRLVETQAERYPEFASLVQASYPDYDWEGIEVETDDGYIITLFHIWKEGQMDPNKGPIMFQHGSGGSAMGSVRGRDNTFIKFVDRGHHVYFGNQRGVLYSRGHKTLDPDTQLAEYWRFSQEDMAQDVFANVEAMFASAGGVNKGYYFGSSLGTSQMTIALTLDEARLTSKLNKVVHFAPCTILGRSLEADLSQDSMEEIGNYVDLGIYSVPSNNWEADVAKICANFDDPTCIKYSNMSADGYNWKPMRQEDHRQQNTLANRYQRYVENWSFDPLVYEAEEYDLTSIQNMPVSFYVPGNDGICLPERAQWYADQIGNLQNYFVFDGWGHSDPAGYRSDDYQNLLIAEVDGPILSAPRIMDQDPNNIVIPSSDDVSPPQPDDDTVVPEPIEPDGDTVIPDEPIDPDTVPTPNELYPDFAQVMDTTFPDVDWEAIEVTTDDGYILTLFHIWKEDLLNDSVGPIMLQHGRGGYATTWLQMMQEAAWTFVHLGHHVYLGNNRGVLYSQGHVELDMYEDAEQYWNFSWHEMAYDVFANVEAMYESAGGVNKGFFFGASQGSLQMNVALTLDESRLFSKLERVVELSPCTVPGKGEEPKLRKGDFNKVGKIQKKTGIYGYPTAPEDWEADLESACEKLGKQDCKKLSRYDADSPVKHSARNDDHWIQAGNTRRFQPFVEDWSYDPLVYEVEEYDLAGVIQMPISLVVGEKDGACSLGRAEWLVDQLGVPVQNFYIIENEGHSFPYANDSAQYIELLVNEVYWQHLHTVTNKQRLHKSLFSGSESIIDGATITIALIKAILKLMR